MSKRPPEDHPILSEILRQLGDVLTPEEAEDVANVVFSEALNNAFSELDGHKTSEISVVEGGAVDLVQDSKDNIRPRLQLVDDEPLLKEDSIPNVRVKVLSPADLLSGVHNVFGGPIGPDLKAPIKQPKAGLIRLDEGATQPIVIRDSEQGYRVTCEEGLCKLWVDEVPYMLAAGQSLDVEGKRLSIQGLEFTTGWFQALR